MSNGNQIRRGRPPLYFAEGAGKAHAVGYVRLLPRDVERLDRVTGNRAEFLRTATLEAIAREEQALERAAREGSKHHE